MKTINAALIGCGNRGQSYSDYTFSHPDEFQVVSVVDTSATALEFAKNRYSVKQENVFSCTDDFIKAKIECDIVIIATQDATHYELCMKVLNAGYNVLLEKPVTSNPTELLDIERLAKEKGLIVLVCHVLRYAPVYKKVKEIIHSGAIGEIVSIEANEHVGVAHYLESYIKGPWRSEKECGSTFLLAKCCHDLDLICWLNNNTTPKSINSFGSRSRYITAKRPSDATEFCYECPRKDTCQVSATKVHLEFESMGFQTYKELIDKLGLQAEDIPRETKLEYLKTSDMGRCAYLDRDLVDRQSVSIEFENGSIANFAMIGGCPTADRYFHIVGTDGEIEGKFDEKKFKVKKIVSDPGVLDLSVQEIDCSASIVVNDKYGGHGGGDYALVYDLVRYLNGCRDSLSITKIDDSINGHFCVYAADDSRREGKLIDFDEYKKQKSR